MGEPLADLHCHILPGIDDGAADVADSLAMACQAAADGIEVVCATPHIRSDHNVVIAELPGRVSELQEAIDAEGLPVRVVPGGEVAAPLADALNDVELAAVSLGGAAGWLLLEPQPGPMDDALDEVVDRMHDRGFRCVIAHPERHAGPDAEDRLRELVQRGALVQVTAAHLQDAEAAPTMLQWAAAGLVHLLGSDSHSARAGRPLSVSGGLKALAGVPSMAPHLDWIAHTAPRAVLAGAPVSVPW